MTHADLDFLAALRKRSADPTLSDMQRLMRMLPDLLHVDQVMEWFLEQDAGYQISFLIKLHDRAPWVAKYRAAHDASPLAWRAMGEGV